MNMSFLPIVDAVVQLLFHWRKKNSVKSGRLTCPLSVYGLIVMRWPTQSNMLKKSVSRGAIDAF